MSGSARVPWWADSVGYEVYIRSFQDSDGDGIGDLPGITSRLEYLAWLGIDVVWLTPFFRSPMADFGYDVCDYTDVDPLFGSIDDFDALIEEAHRLGLKVVSDMVPNHSSDHHPWFVESRSSRENPRRDFYIWRDPDADGGPPNNWLGHFGGPAWTFDEQTGQYYCHLFLPEQPDLNWRNPEVRAEFEKILRFWLDRGIDGFRIDVAQSLYKDPEFRDNPILAPLEEVTNARDRFARMEHKYDLLQPESLQVYRQWNEIAAEYDAVLIGETYVHDPLQLAGLVPGDGLHVGFWFRAMHMDWNREAIIELLRAPGDDQLKRVGWVLSSHDASRPVARFGGGDLGRRRALGLTTLLHGLPGVPFIYQGEELGLDDARLDGADKVDPLEVRNESTPGRDVCRTPIPWETGPNLGFTDGADPWLPIAYSEAESVASQRADASSILHRYRALLDLRRELAAHHHTATVQWIDDRDLVGFWRGEIGYLLNPGDQPRPVPTDEAIEILYRTTGELGASGTDAIEAAEAVVVRKVS